MKTCKECNYCSDEKTKVHEDYVFCNKFKYWTNKYQLCPLVRIFQNEIWKNIKGYNGRYRISNHGRIKSVPIINLKRKINPIKPKEKILKNFINDGYCFIALCLNSKTKAYPIHRLVLSYFLREPKSDEECNHIDRNRSNNHIDNLEWVTSKENSLHSIENMSKSKQGEKHPVSKVTDQQAIEIKRMRKQKIRHKVIADKFNITIQDSINIATRYYKHIDHLV